MIEVILSVLLRSNYFYLIIVDDVLINLKKWNKKSKKLVGKIFNGFCLLLE